MRDDALWERLKFYEFPLNDGKDRLDLLLAREKRIPKARIPAALEEYRRFLYLAAVAGETVAPSPFIDRIWHRHLADTGAYIGDLCERVVGRVIHHRRGRAYAADDPAYAATLSHYHAEFGHQPDGRIWPSQRLLQAGRKLRHMPVLAFFAVVVVAFVAHPWIVPAVFFALIALSLVTYATGPWGFAGEGESGWRFELSIGGGGDGGDGDGDGGCGGD